MAFRIGSRTLARRLKLDDSPGLTLENLAGWWVLGGGPSGSHQFQIKSQLLSGQHNLPDRFSGEIGHDARLLRDPEDR